MNTNYPRFVKSGIALVVLALCSAAAFAQVAADFDLPAQPLSDSLRVIAARTESNVLFDKSLVAGLSARPLKLHGTAREALKQILGGTGLTYKVLDEKTVTLVPAEDGGQSLARPTSDSQEGLAKADTLEEVVVTAQKKTENLLDVPVPVTALSASALAERNQLKLSDYYASVPGLNFVADGHGNPVLSIRGITTGGGNPTIGITIDGVPFGSSSSYGGLVAQTPDLDPSQLARVEVLRGPQGTLYGASSMGGLINFVTVDPSVSGLSGRIEGGLETVQNSSQTGYNIRGAVNAPITDALAVSASGFGRHEPGYIDNILTGEKGANVSDVYGGRVAALWRATETVAVKLSALVQDNKLDGSPLSFVNPGFADLQQSMSPGTGGSDRKAQLYSATVTAKLGSVDFTSISGYNVIHTHFVDDYTMIFGPLSQIIFGTTGTNLTSDASTRKFTEEMRFSGSAGRWMDWLVGAYYSHERSRTEQDILAFQNDTGAIVGSWLNDVWPSTYADVAGFADLTFHLTDRIDVQLGGRESSNRQTYQETLTGPYGPLLAGLPSPIVQPEIDTRDNAFTYLLTPSFKITPDMLLYARIASGYRAGGPNPTASVYNLPPNFKPDKTRNYEVGFKGALLNRKVSFDLSLYRIDWDDIQLSVIQPVSFQLYYVNASKAKSQGVDLSLEFKPWTGGHISASASVNDATTDGFPAGAAAYAVSGDRLPYSARFSGYMLVGQEFPLSDEATGFAEVSGSYVGNRMGGFGGSPTQVRTEYPAYAKLDIHGGVRYSAWTVNLFANNLTNKRGIVGGGLGSVPGYAFQFIQPRTVGVSVAKTF